MPNMFNNPVDDQFQLDLNSAIYNAIADTVYKYDQYIQDGDALENAVNLAIDWWSTHFFESDDWNA